MSGLYTHRESDEYLLKPEHFAEKKNRPKRWDCLRPIIYTSLAIVGFIEILFFGIFFAQATRKTPERLLGELNGLVGDCELIIIYLCICPWNLGLTANGNGYSSCSESHLSLWSIGCIGSQNRGIQTCDDEQLVVVYASWVLQYMPSDGNHLTRSTGGNGFIAVNQSEGYTLPPPIKQLGQDTYSIAVFHQLHCLVCHVLSRISLGMGFIVSHLQFSTQSCRSMTTWQQPNRQQI